MYVMYVCMCFVYVCEVRALGIHCVYVGSVMYPCYVCVCARSVMYVR